MRTGFRHSVEPRQYVREVYAQKSVEVTRIFSQHFEIDDGDFTVKFVTDANDRQLQLVSGNNSNGAGVKPSIALQHEPESAVTTLEMNRIMDKLHRLDANIGELMMRVPEQNNITSASDLFPEKSTA